MNKVAFIFSSAPHGNSAGREGLDALLALSALNKEVGVFFIRDGVFQLLIDQHPDIIMARNYINTFKILLLYDIKDIWICATSMQERGLKEDTALIINAKPFLANVLHEKLSYYNIILTF